MTCDRRIFVGDVHGHYDGLMGLLNAIAPRSTDQIYFLGDLIDRGPKSADVLKFVREHGYPSLLGNHEQLLLDSFPSDEGIFQPAFQSWLMCGGQSTMASFQQPSDLLDYLDWLRTLPTHMDLGDIWLAHAGVHPRLALEDQSAYEYCWIRDEFHSMRQPYFQDKLIITGHTITFTLPGIAPGELARGQGWLDIDTGAYHPRSGWLTAVDMTYERVYQINVFQGEVRSLPLAEAAVQIDPSKIPSRRQLITTTR
jgi:serine/threonine protein phosphatase 1